ncbi:MAG TPA: radical SAM protein [Desulfobulbaceae bacterium]|nr:radical SAM protein [Desulfobulbaceae bacterium]
MHYEGTVIRPPSEANSIILQVSIGCSHNRCTFCGAYQDKQFRLRNVDDINRDIAFAGQYCRRQKTLFLADGNVLALPHRFLVDLFNKIRHKLPWVRRISMYGGCRDILNRSVDQLTELKKLGLGRLYMGLESGHDPTLVAVKKGATAEEMVAAGRRVRAAAIFLSVTCLLGLAGDRQATSLAHAKDTADVLNRIQPSQIAILTLMLLDNTELGQKAQRGEFSLPDKQQLFIELRTLIAGLSDFRTLVQANHSSNYFQLDGRLPRDKEKFLFIIDQALSGAIGIKPEYLRAL